MLRIGWSQTTGYKHLDDDGLVNHVAGELSGEQDSSDELDDGGPSEIPTEESIHVISHQEAMDMFDKCLTWLQCQPETTPHNTGVLLSLKEIVAKKRLSALWQLTLTYYLQGTNELICYMYRYHSVSFIILYPYLVNYHYRCIQYMYLVCIVILKIL